MMNISELPDVTQVFADREYETINHKSEGEADKRD